MERPVATEQAPPARPPSSVPSRRDAVGRRTPRRHPVGQPVLPDSRRRGRAASIAALIVLDLVGLVLGVYAALALRELVYGEGDPLWGFLWNTETDWLPFLTLITVLIFWQAGLYADPSGRGFGRILASLIFVAVITMIFALGVGHEFETYGLAPTAVILSAVSSACSAAATASSPATCSSSRDTAARDPRGRRGEPCSAPPVAGGEPWRIDYDFVGADPTSSDGAGLPCLGSFRRFPRSLRSARWTS